jgi:putative ABC transport system permease protein
MRAFWFLFRVMNLERLTTRTLRVFFGVAAVTAGVGIVFGVLLLNASITASFGGYLETLLGKGDLEVFGAVLQSDLLQQLKSLRSDPMVGVAAPILEGRCIVRGPRGQTEATVIGADESLTEIAAHLVNENDFVDPDAGPGIVAAASLLNTVGQARDGTLELSSGGSAVTLPVAALMPQALGKKLNGGRLILVPLEAAQELLDQAGAVSSIVVRPTQATTKSADELRKKLEAKLPKGTQVEPITWRVRELERSVAPMRAFSGLVCAILLLAIVFLLYNSTMMTVTERSRELALFLGLGERPAKLVLRLLGETLVVATLGGFAGLFLGYWLGQALVAKAPGFVESAYGFKTELAVEPIQAVVAFVAGLGATIVGAIQPALSILQLPVVHHLRPQPPGELAKGPEFRPSGVVLGLAIMLAGFISGITVPQFGSAFLAAVFAGAALLLFQTSVAAMLRLTNFLSARLTGADATWYLVSCAVQESPRRTAATVTVAAISIAIVVAIGGVAQSVMKSAEPFADAFLAYDCYVTSAGEPYVPVPLSPGVSQTVRALPNLDRADELRGSFVRWKGRRIWLLGESAEASEASGFKLASGNAQAATESLRKNGVLVSTQFAAFDKLHLGDLLELDFPKGPQEFRVSAIQQSWSWPEGTMVIGSAEFARGFGQGPPNELRLRFRGLAPQAALQAVRAAAPGASVRTGRQIRDAILTQLSAQFAPFDLIKEVAVLMVVVMVLNTMTLALIQRRRENGVLRAIGLSGDQLGQNLVVESFVVASVAVGYGLVLGLCLEVLGLGILRAATGLPIDWSLPWRPLAAGGLAGLLAVVIATIQPALKAARQPVAESLLYE